MSELKISLYRALMGTQQTLDEALNEASKNIAEIGGRNTTVIRRAVRRDGVSSTKLYDLPTHQRVRARAG